MELPSDFPSRHVDNIGPKYVEMLVEFVEYALELGYQPAPLATHLAKRERKVAAMNIAVVTTANNTFGGVLAKAYYENGGPAPDCRLCAARY